MSSMRSRRRARLEGDALRTVGLISGIKARQGIPFDGVPCLCEVVCFTSPLLRRIGVLVEMTGWRLPARTEQLAHHPARGTTRHQARRGRRTTGRNHAKEVVNIRGVTCTRRVL